MPTTKPKPLISRLLEKLDACEEGREWASQFKTPSAAWLACENPEWMIWALDEAGLWTDQQARRFACWCVRETPLQDGRKVWDLLTDERSRKAVEVAERFAEGNATQDELDAAWAAARAAARDAAWAAARAAAWAAARDAQAKHLRKMFGNPFRDKKILAKLIAE